MREDRANAEKKAQAGVEISGHDRLKTGKTKQINYRCTEQKLKQLKQLAAKLSIGKSQVATYIETLDQALDALDEKLQGAKR